MEDRSLLSGGEIGLDLLYFNNPPLVEAPVAVTASEDAAGFSVNLLQGAADPDGDPLSVANFVLTGGNAAGIVRSGSYLTVNPLAYNDLAPGQSATISYSYDIVDGRGGAVTQTATITITGANDAPVLATTGDAWGLDPSFDADGKAITDFGNSEYGWACVLQPDGKVVVGGTWSMGYNASDYGLARYNLDGSLDTTFSGDGKQGVGVGSEDHLQALALQGDGKIVAAGYSYIGYGYDVSVVRLHVDGALDTSFSDDGKLSYDLGSSHDEARAVGIQTDGKIIVAGYTESAPGTGNANNDFALVRFSADGALDTTFGNAGKVITDFNARHNVANCLAVQGDGKIVAAGYSYNGNDGDFGLARYNADGSLDTTFDGDGKVTTAFAGNANEQVFALAIQPDGKIVAAGYSYTSKYLLALARYNTDGSLDTTFGTGGTVRWDSGADVNIGYGLAIQSDGRIVVGGHQRIATDNDFLAVRFQSNGAVDTTFGVGGTLTANFGLNDYAYGIALTADGRIVLAGSVQAASQDFGAARFALNKGPTVPVSAAASEDAAVFTVDLLAGATDPDGDPLGVANLTLASGDGAGVTLVGNTLRVNPSSYNSLAVGASAVISYQYQVVDSRGGAVSQTATITITGANDDPLASGWPVLMVSEDEAAFDRDLLFGARDPDGDPLGIDYFTLVSGDDRGFAREGNTLHVNPGAYNALAAGAQSAVLYGYLVVDGHGGAAARSMNVTITGVNDAPVVDVPITATASEDAVGFSVNLLAGASDPDGDPLAVANLTLTGGNAVGVQTGGNTLAVRPWLYNYLAAGEPAVIAYSYTIVDGNGGSVAQTATITITGANDSPVLATTGDAWGLDPSFDADGTLLTDLGSGAERVGGVAMQLDGKIVVAASGFFGMGTRWDFAAIRYNADGSLDGTFSDGVANVDFAGGDEHIGGVAIQSDGRIVLAGKHYNGFAYDAALARLNPDGSLDTTFGGDGRVTTDFGTTYDDVSSVAVGADGRIVVAGYKFDGAAADVVVARYLSDGSLDTTFGAGGRVTTDFGGAYEYYHRYNVAVQSDGKVVVAGSSGSGDNIVLARYNVDGSLDATFAGGGLQVAGFSGPGPARALAIQPDGKFVVAGRATVPVGGTYSQVFAVARFNPDGNFDFDFGSNGVATIDVGESDDYGESLALLPDGKLVVAGYSYSEAEGNRFAAARLNPDGSFDTTLVGNAGPGRVITDFGADDQGACVAVDPDGRVIVAGRRVAGAEGEVALARYVVDKGPTARLATGATEDDLTFTVDLLAGASDPDATDVLSVSGLTQTSGHADGITIAGNSLIINPAAYNVLEAGESEVITYRYHVVDGHGGSVMQRAAITITGVNDPPQLLAILYYAGGEDDPSWSANLLAGATDPDIEALNVANLNFLGGGTPAGITPAGSSLLVDGTPYQFLHSGQHFWVTSYYDVVDPHGGSVAQTTYISFFGANDAPTVGATPMYAAGEDDGFFYADLLAGASDVDNQTAFSITNLALAGGDGSGISIWGGSYLRVDPSAYNYLAAGAWMTATYTYTINDGWGGTVEQTGYVTIFGSNDAPQANSDQAEVALDGSVVLNVLANDTDADHAPGQPANAGLQVVSVAQPAAGTAVLNPDGTITYTPPAAVEHGRDDIFTYTIRDAAGATATAAIGVSLVDPVAPNTIQRIATVVEIVGSEVADTFTLTNRNGNLYRNGANTGVSLAGATEVHVYARGGNDRVDVSRLALASFIHGGEGNDTILGGAARNILFGDGGDDRLTGGAAGDFLIGGLGADTLGGGGGHDILFAGDLDFRATRLELEAMLAAWIAEQASRPATDLLQTAASDGFLDTLTGGAGNDRFHAADVDRLTDRRS